MSITAWKTWASGDILTAADMNAYVRDNGRWLSHNATGGSPLARVYHNVDQSVARVTDVALAFNSERYDAMAMHDAGDNTKLSTPTGGGGKYLYTAHIAWADASDTTRRVLSIRHTDGGAFYPARASWQAANGAITFMSIAAVYSSSAGNYAEVLVRQEHASLAVLCVALAPYSPEFTACWMAE